PNWSLVAIQFASSLVSKAPEEELKKTKEEMINTQFQLEKLSKNIEGHSIENFTKTFQKTGTFTKDSSVSRDKLQKEQKKMEEELDTLHAKYDELNATRKRIYNRPIDLIRKNSRLAGLLDRTEKN